MTWTVLYREADDFLKQKTVNAPHGEKDAWEFISANYNWNIVAIVAGMHNLYYESISH